MRVLSAHRRTFESAAFSRRTYFTRAILIVALRRACSVPIRPWRPIAVGFDLPPRWDWTTQFLTPGGVDAALKAAPRASSSPRRRGISRAPSVGGPDCETGSRHASRPRSRPPPTAPPRSRAMTFRPASDRTPAATHHPRPPTPPRRRGRHTERPPQIAGPRVEPRPVRCHVQCHLEGIADRIERAASGDPHLLGAPTAFELDDQRPASDPRAPRPLCPRAPQGPVRRCAPARPRAWAPPTRTAKAALLVERILEAVQPEALDSALGLRLGAQLKTRPA